MASLSERLKDRCIQARFGLYGHTFNAQPCDKPECVYCSSRALCALVEAFQAAEQALEASRNDVRAGSYRDALTSVRDAKARLLEVNVG